MARLSIGCMLLLMAVVGSVKLAPVVETTKEEDGKLAPDVETTKEEDGKLVPDVETTKEEDGKLAPDVETRKDLLAKMYDELENLADDLDEQLADDEDDEDDEDEDDEDEDEDDLNKQLADPAALNGTATRRDPATETQEIEKRSPYRRSSRRRLCHTVRIGRRRIRHCYRRGSSSCRTFRHRGRRIRHCHRPRSRRRRRPSRCHRHGNRLHCTRRRTPPRCHRHGDGRRHCRRGDATTEKQDTEKGTFGSTARRMDISSSQDLTKKHDDKDNSMDGGAATGKQEIAKRTIGYYILSRLLEEM